MNANTYRKLFFVLIFLTLITVSFLIIKPFLSAILTGIVFSYIFYPIYSNINKKITSRNISAFITSVLVVLVLTLPLFFILNSISKEAYATYLLSKQKASNVEFLATECIGSDRLSCKFINFAQNTINDPQIKYYIDTTVEGVTTKITEGISNLLITVPRYILHMFITLFVMFFLFKDGKILLNKVEGMLPLKERHRKRVFSKLSEMTFAVIYGSIIIAVIQGTLGGIGFFFFGISTPILWGIVMMFASLIPFVGSALIWLPAALLLIFNGYVSLETNLIIRGILLMIYGLLIVGTIDNFLRPKIIGDKGGLHPVFVLLGVVGGLQLLGFIGVLIGPIFLALLITFITIYEDEADTK